MARPPAGSHSAGPTPQHVMDEDYRGDALRCVLAKERTAKQARLHVAAGSDASRHRLDFCLFGEEGGRLELTAAPPDADGLRALVKEDGGSYGPLLIGRQGAGGTASRRARSPAT